MTEAYEAMDNILVASEKLLWWLWILEGGMTSLVTLLL